MADSDSMRDCLVDCLSKQLSELELFQSMYPKPEEVCLTDRTILDVINSFITHNSEYTPPHLDFVLNITINGMKVEMCINLPSFYPNEEPDVYVRCNSLNRHQESKLNADLTNYIKVLPHDGDTCLYTILSWVQDNIQNIENITDCDVDDNDQTETDVKFARYWIYSHHIFNKKKRELIISHAKECDLTGFCLPGKPGVICVEGDESSCKDFWKMVKSMSWKKIVIRQTEVYDIEERKSNQKFHIFEEFHFDNVTARGSNKSSCSKYLEQHGLSQFLKDLFGFCNDSM